ncbi:MAG: tRNA (N6-threonylcarbamoyladenosine(37)-N6)-methyltransferase TrmO [Deltaproteobacteria bacterium]|nr:tRNA (N6-threonylcarbamoyladenosine(37)-N6)-methyltransferase TrmO [Desulfobacterales bacterium]MDL1973498.1 tRNA (N6-threonylcarbamoyladenosine(37)-N6)-methyltransferase TrmO [Deltaproteobacteria bacterium]
MKKSIITLGLVFLCIVSPALLTDTAQCEQQDAIDSFRVFPVGKVKKASGTTTIEIYDKYADALSGLNRFSHVVVLYWFHKNDTPERRRTSRVHPRRNPSNPLTGVFATRSPRRPNLIGLSVCKILSVEKNIVRIDSIDAFHDTPVLDLKPYLPRMDTVQGSFGPQWAE